MATDEKRINGCVDLYPLIRLLIRCLDGLDFAIRQPVQMVHQFVNRRVRVCVVHAPLERVTPILFFALGYGVLFLRLHAAP